MPPKQGKKAKATPPQPVEPARPPNWARALREGVWDASPAELPDAAAWPTWGALRELILSRCRSVSTAAAADDAFVAELVRLAPAGLTSLVSSCCDGEVLCLITEAMVHKNTLPLAGAAGQPPPEPRRAVAGQQHACAGQPGPVSLHQPAVHLPAVRQPSKSKPVWLHCPGQGGAAVPCAGLCDAEGLHRAGQHPAVERQAHEHRPGRQPGCF